MRKMHIDEAELHEAIREWRSDILAAHRERRRPNPVPRVLRDSVRYIVHGRYARRNFALYPFVKDGRLHRWAYEFVLETLRFSYNIDQDAPRPGAYINTCAAQLGREAVKSWYRLKEAHPDADEGELTGHVGRGIPPFVRRGFAHLLT